MHTFAFRSETGIKLVHTQLFMSSSIVLSDILSYAEPPAYMHSHCACRVISVEGIGSDSHYCVDDTDMVIMVLTVLLNP